MAKTADSAFIEIITIWSDTLLLMITGKQIVHLAANINVSSVILYMEAVTFPRDFTVHTQFV